MNATQKQGRVYDSEELLALAADARERKAPDWVTGGLITQATGTLTRTCPQEGAHEPHNHEIHHKALHYTHTVYCPGE